MQLNHTVLEQASLFGGAMTKHIFQEADTRSMKSFKSDKEKALDKAVEYALISCNLDGPYLEVQGTFDWPHNCSYIPLIVWLLSRASQVIVGLKNRVIGQS